MSTPIQLNNVISLHNKQCHDVNVPSEQFTSCSGHLNDDYSELHNYSTFLSTFSAKHPQLYFQNALSNICHKSLHHCRKNCLSNKSRTSVAEWVCRVTSHSTHNRSFRRRELAWAPYLNSILARSFSCTLLCSSMSANSHLSLASISSCSFNLFAWTSTLKH